VDRDGRGAAGRRRPRSRTAVATGGIALSVAALALGACGGGSGTSSPAGTTQIIVETVTVPPGQLVYLRSCARCHGETQEGKQDAPALDAVKLATAGDQGLRTLLAVGKGRMPAFGGLSPAEVDELVTYLRRTS
jgi:mono/diheme cytochrome c family protein